MCIFRGSLEFDSTLIGYCVTGLRSWVKIASPSSFVHEQISLLYLKDNAGVNSYLILQVANRCLHAS